ncbi:MAG: outer membrane lipoprotein-sorting protein [Epsilonproteobacteria bacterium]|nr:MAG: outer membrane lipoprotein-sorting protein [Campylobacterota bacterium]
MKKYFVILISIVILNTNIFAISAKEIAQKSYNVNHTLYVDNVMIKKKKRKSILTISRMPGKKARVTAIERFLLNEHKNDVVESKDLVLIRSGKLKGLGVLMTSYLDPKRSHEYLMWIPALRKVRRMAEPKDAGLGTGDIAFLEDAKLRRFDEESYQLIETKKMDLALEMMSFKKGEFAKYSKYIPRKKTIYIRNKKIHILKSTYKSKHHWYDYRISYIDSESFTDYVTKYYKNAKEIKKVYRHWTTLGNLSDPKAKIWYYWYSKDSKTGYEMLNYIPPSLIKVNQKIPKSFWSVRTLEKIKR